jgi:hypothetical protein
MFHGVIFRNGRIDTESLAGGTIVSAGTILSLVGTGVDTTTLGCTGLLTGVSSCEFVSIDGGMTSRGRVVSGGGTESGVTCAKTGVPISSTNTHKEKKRSK